MRAFTTFVLTTALVTACGSDEPPRVTWRAVPGAPPAVWSLSFDPTGAPIVIGGARTFGELYLQRPRGDVWVRADGVPVAKPSDAVYRAGGVTFASVDATVHRLDDVAAFRWSSLGNPTQHRGNHVRVIGVSADGQVFALGTDDVPGETGPQNVILRWSTGQTEWRPIPNAVPKQGLHTARVDANGRATWSTYDGIWRAEPGGSATRVVDCDQAEYLYCDSHISSIATDDAGNLSFLVCPFTVNHRAIYRLDAGATEARKLVDVPREYPYCLGIQQIADGTLFLVTATDNTVGKDVAMFRLSPGASTLTRVEGDFDGNYSFAVRDASTVFRYGDGHFAAGVDEGRL